MTLGAAVGNDVVDLLDPRTHEKHLDPLFLARVLDAGERAALREAHDPLAWLWAFWAAKESAYKVASKLRGQPPVFVHPAFGVTWTEGGPERWRGSVVWEGLRFPVEVTRANGAIQGVAAAAAELGCVTRGAERLADPPEAWPAALREMLPRLTPREADAVHSFPSAAVRLRARRALAELLAADERDVEIVCDPGVTGRRPPRVLLRGRPADADVSLSHHGRWIAWAILLIQNPLGR